MYSLGGRGGIVYHVTKLDSALDDPERNDFGTLRYGLNNSNFPANVPRTIVFDVGGVFDLGRGPLASFPEWDANGNGWDTQSRLTLGGTNITYAGQTAPGSGVIFMGGGLKPQGSNNIIRNVTVASGYGMRNWWDPGDPKPDPPPATVPPEDRGVGIFPDATVYDAMDINGQNLIIDHVSTIYATDETISMGNTSNNVSVQYSNISQGQNYPQWDPDSSTPHYTGHALGSLLEAPTNAAVSFHHNLYAHQKSRVPQTQGGSAYYDFRNNVFYNWTGTAGARNNSTRLNLVGNFYLSGNGGEEPDGGNDTGLHHVNGGTSVIGGTSSNLYLSGNLRDTNNDGDIDEAALVSGGGASSPLWSGGVDTYKGVTQSADVAFDYVLDYVGANWWTRGGGADTPDERLIDETRTGMGEIIAWADDPWNDDPSEGTEWRALKNTPQANRPVDWDTEASVGYGVGDGMPTYWELQHGLDPNAYDNNGDFDNDGYTNLEEYLNEVAAWPAPNEIVFNNTNSDGRYAHILNWDANPETGSEHPWQPSRYDTAIVDNGTVTVDAVGQHAGNLLLATNPGDNATLNITAGWLKVEDAPHGMSDGVTVIGDNNGAIAELNLSGGKLTTKTLLKGDGGTFNFTGGTLSAETVVFDLVNDGGTISPGQSPGQTHVMGDLTINSGALNMEIASALDFDKLLVDEEALLGGVLNVSLIDYIPAPTDVFEIVTADSLAGVFANATSSIFASLGTFDVTYTANSVTLSNFESAALFGDYNNDGVVDAADYTTWRDAMTAASTFLMNDPTPGTVDESDFLFWRNHFGESLSMGSGSGQAAVPEPASLSLAALCLLLLGAHRRLIGL